MDASVRKVMGLISEMNVRYEVPVYQRPYLWGEDQCVQLWDDVLSTGRRADDSTHFTGSIVTMQDGSLSPEGVAPLLLIDGQQRITTIALLLVALARFAAANPRRRLAFSFDEILMSGYLTNEFRTGADHYKLTLSKGDRKTFASLIDNLEDPTVPVVSGPSRLVENLAFFERRIAALDDVDSVWTGLRRLEVVSIALAQGKDDPQLIFESMNSTGKDLDLADLVRNFVLMGYPMRRQAQVYETYWRTLEEVLGSMGLGSFEDEFEGFVRCFFSMEYAPQSLGDADVYQAFKRYVQYRGYDRNDRMKFLCLRLKTFAEYYAAIRTGRGVSEGVARALARVTRLSVPAVEPLLLVLLDAVAERQISEAGLVGMLGMLEGYLVRRAVCDRGESSYERFFSSLTARIDATRHVGADCAEALSAMLLAEEDPARALPGDAEFAHALRTRDFYDFGGAGLVLARLEDALRPADADVDATRFVVERVMPLGADEMPDWIGVLGAAPGQAYLAGLNDLGNLTLTPYDYDLQRASFAEKRARIASGDPVLGLSADVVAADAWDPERIADRAEKFVSLALDVWPLPTASPEALRTYRPSARAAKVSTVSFADLFAAGRVQMDDHLVSSHPLYPGRATVTSGGGIMLANGETFDDPDAAYQRFLGTVGASDTNLSGWMYWRLGEGGPLLDSLRA